MRRWSDGPSVSKPEEKRVKAPAKQHEPPVEPDPPAMPSAEERKIETQAEKLEAYEKRQDDREKRHTPSPDDQRKVEQHFEKLTADDVLADKDAIMVPEDDANYDALTAMMEREGSLMIAVDKLVLRYQLAKYDHDETEDRLKRFTMAAMEARRRVISKKAERIAFIKSGIRHGMESLGEKSMKTMCGTAVSLIYPNMHSCSLEVAEEPLINYCREMGKEEDWKDFIEPVTTYRFSKSKFKARLKAYVEGQKAKGLVPEGQEVVAFVKAANMFPGVVATAIGNTVRIRPPKGFDAITMADAHGEEGVRYLEEVIEVGYRPEKEGDRASE